MDTLHEQFRHRLTKIYDQIQGACNRSGRTADDVTLIAITKTQPVEVLQALIDIGVTHLGENRVIEIVEKVPQLKGIFTMHLVGALQTNKVAKVLPFIQMIQSVDRTRLVDFLERYIPEDTTLPVLLEVNTSAESSKSGCSPNETRALLELLASSKKLQPTGYMTIGPLGSNESAVRKSFAHLAKIADTNRDLIAAPQLSMGMSGDFEWAIEEGATMVRIGTLLTGGR